MFVDIEYTFTEEIVSETSITYKLHNVVPVQKPEI